MPNSCKRKGHTHSVCVCTIHLNVYLILFESKLQYTYSANDLVDKIVYSVESEYFLLEECKDCPGPEDLLELLQNLEDYDLVEEVSCNQWISTDRTSLVTVILSYEQFVEELVEKLWNGLRTHSYVTQDQARFLKCLKANSEPRHSILLQDSLKFTLL